MMKNGQIDKFIFIFGNWFNNFNELAHKKYISRHFQRYGSVS